MNRSHKRAVWLLISVVIADVISGLIVSAVEHVPAWHGIYCTMGITTTVGCDIPFTTWPSYALAWLAMVMLVPLWAAIFSFFTSGLTASHLDKQTAEFHAKTDAQTAEFHAKTDAQTQQLKDHVDGSPR